MNIFDLIIVQPIFNLLLFIYNFVGDYGIAIIILTIIIRFALWPMVRKQMRQTKVMREIQPEVKKIKAKAKGDKMVESQLTMALYKEKGVKPFSSILVLIIQLPIFIAVFTVIRNYIGFLEGYVYPFLQNFGNIPQMIADPGTPHFFGIDLTAQAFGENGMYLPILLLAILAAALQFFQSRQLRPPKSENKKKLREHFKDAAAGKEVDQSEMSASMTQNMMYLFPILTFVIAISLPGAVVLYFATQAAVAVGQQKYMLSRKENPDKEKKGKKPLNTKRVKNAQEAVVVKRPSSELKPKSGSGGKTVVRRIKSK